MRTIPLSVTLALAASLSATAKARTIVVSKAGEDGTVPTISQAAQLALPGDTILVKAGVYRERVTPPRGGKLGKPITYRGEKLGTVFIRGSELWEPKWQSSGDGLFSASPDDALFDDDVYVDSANPFRVELASTPYARQGKPEAERYGNGRNDLVYTCGQIIVNGEPWEQRPFLSEIKSRPHTWHFEADSGRVHINFGELAPGGQQIEITTRRRNFAPHIKGLGHIVVEGFVMEHCGNQYPTNFWSTPKWAQAGALGLRGGHHWAVRNNLIRYANADGIDMGSRGGDNERDPQSIAGAPYGEDNLIENNYIVDNGAGGICGSTTTRLVVRGNVILRNNTQGFVGKKRYEHSGFKAHGIRDAMIERNYVADNPRSEGIWLDNQFPGTRVTRNVIVGNGRRGIFLEMSDYQWDAALVDHNISIGNGTQFYVHDASGSTVMHNLFANSAADAKYGQGAYIYQVTARTKTGYHSLFNNLFVNHKDGVMLDVCYPAHRGGPQRFDHNVYDAKPAARAFRINSASDVPSPWQADEFFALVKKDVGAGAPEAIDGGKKVALTLDEWRAFWKTHGEENDGGSAIREGTIVTYDEKSFTLKITLPFDPSETGSVEHAKVERDFFGKALPGEKALPGPFQNLRKGENSFRIWDGLPLLGKGELPR
jgi:hypothetical protein